MNTKDEILKLKDGESEEVASCPSKCKKCGTSIKGLMILALIVDAGGKASPSPLECTADGGEHEF